MSVLQSGHSMPLVCGISSAYTRGHSIAVVDASSLARPVRIPRERWERTQEASQETCCHYWQLSPLADTPRMGLKCSVTITLHSEYSEPP